MSETPPNEPIPQAPAPGPALPWEAPNAGLGSIVPTSIAFIARPLDAYAWMSLNVDLVRPIAYFVLLGLFGACVGQLWKYLLFDSLVGVFRQLAGSQADMLAPLLKKPTAIQLVVALIVTPLVSLIGLFIWSALVHVTLVILGGAKRGFTATLRVVCYAQTTQLAVIVPGFGGLIAFVWALILEIVGLSTAHRTDGWKAALAVILPLFFCCVCVVGAVVTFGAAMIQAFQQMK